MDLSDDRIAAGELQQLDVVGLLRAYRAALTLARHPPASLDLPPVIECLHRRLRPTFGCHYFVTRQVRRRITVVERALAARTAVGEGDENDQAELDALRSFKASLRPPPSRGWTVAGLIAAIVMTQTLMAGLSFIWSGDGKKSPFLAAIDNVSLSPDVRSVGDLGGALVSADYVQLGVLVLSIVCVLYLLARPLTSGYRLAQLCMDRRLRLSPRRARSPLCRRAATLAIPQQEAVVARVAGAEFRRDAPIDILVTVAPCIAITYLAIGLTRFWGETGVSPRDAAWLAASAVLLAVVAELPRRVASLRPTRWRITLVLAAIVGAALLSALILDRDALERDSSALLWLAIYAVALARLAWLVNYTRAAGQSMLWIAAPLAVMSLIAAGARYDNSSTEAAHDRDFVVGMLGADDVPRISPHELQLLLLTRGDLVDADLRTQDLRSLSLRDKDLSGALLGVADLRGVDLRHANLHGADLFAARASGASMGRARLTDTDLRCADLSGVDLRGADLRGAALADANLANVVADRTTRWPAGFDVRKALQEEAEFAEAERSFGDYPGFYQRVGVCLFEQPANRAP